MPNTIASVEKPISVWRSTDDTLKYKMKLLLYLLLFCHYIDTKKTRCANIPPLKHHRKLLPVSYIIFWFMEWQSPNFTKSPAWYGSFWNDWASRLCSLCKDRSLWPGCGLPHLGKRFQGGVPSFGWACQRNLWRMAGETLKSIITVVTDPAIFRPRRELRNKLWEWWFEI